MKVTGGAQIAQTTPVHSLQGNQFNSMEIFGCEYKAPVTSSSIIRSSIESIRGHVLTTVLVLVSSNQINAATNSLSDLESSHDEANPVVGLPGLYRAEPGPGAPGGRLFCLPLYPEHRLPGRESRAGDTAGSHFYVAVRLRREELSEQMSLRLRPGEMSNKNKGSLHCEERNVW